MRNKKFDINAARRYPESLKTRFAAFRSVNALFYALKDSKMTNLALNLEPAETDRY